MHSPHKPRDLTQFKGKGEISCKKEGQNLTFSIRKVRLCNRFQRKFYLMRKKRKRRKNPNRFNYHNRVATNVVKTYHIYSVLEIVCSIGNKKAGKFFQASFMIEANSYKKVIGCIQCSWRFLMASLLNGSLTLLVSTWLHKYLLSSMYRKVENVQRQNWLCT